MKRAKLTNERIPIKDDNNNDSIRDPVIKTIVKHEARPRTLLVILFIMRPVQELL